MKKSYIFFFFHFSVQNKKMSKIRRNRKQKEITNVRHVESYLLKPVSLKFMFKQNITPKKQLSRVRKDVANISSTKMQLVDIWRPISQIVNGRLFAYFVENIFLTWVIYLNILVALNMSMMPVFLNLVHWPGMSLWRKAK